MALSLVTEGPIGTDLYVDEWHRSARTRRPCFICRKPTRGTYTAEQDGKALIDPMPLCARCSIESKELEIGLAYSGRQSIPTPVFESGGGGGAA